MSRRDFAKAMDMPLSKISKMERGLIPYPTDEEWLHRLYEKLGFDAELHQLWRELFIMQKMSENFIPLFVCTESGNPISEEKMVEFIEQTNNMAKEHNKKADEYNAKQSL